jgi:hypothetical protein
MEVSKEHSMNPEDFSTLYQRFDSPLMMSDCGERCSPHNERNVPFCCDIRHAVPTVYEAEWEYLKTNTDLWHIYQNDDLKVYQALQRQLPDQQVYVECRGHLMCQRKFRSIVCRAFPFFPYLNLKGEFLGLSYYWEYEDRCWVISNLGSVTQEFRNECMETFRVLMDRFPLEQENFRSFSILMRRIFGRRKRAIPLLHRNGFNYKVTPRTGRLRRMPPDAFSMFGVYKISAGLPFPDEIVRSF